MKLYLTFVLRAQNFAVGSLISAVTVAGYSFYSYWGAFADFAARNLARNSKFCAKNGTSGGGVADIQVHFAKPLVL